MKDIKLAKRLPTPREEKDLSYEGTQRPYIIKRVLRAKSGQGAYYTFHKMDSAITSLPGDTGGSKNSGRMRRY